MGLEERWGFYTGAPPESVPLLLRVDAPVVIQHVVPQLGIACSRRGWGEEAKMDVLFEMDLF